MTELAELLADCDAHGIRLLPAGDGGLTIDAPQGALTPALVARMKVHKSELLAILDPKAEQAGDELHDEPANDSEPMVLGPDGWTADCIEFGEVPPCPNCGTLALWQTLVGNWRCQRCDPPTTARRIAKLAEQIRQRKYRRIILD